MSLRIRGTGRALPKNRVTNFDLAKKMDTSDEWIQSRTGITERRICSEGEDTLTMGAEAAREALRDAGLEPSDLAMIICSSVAPSMVIPPLACGIMAKIGARCPAFDINVACTGFVYALKIADAMSAGPILIVCAEQTSRYIDPDDRRVAVLFGDGAAAVVTEPGEGLLHLDVRAAPDTAGALFAPGLNYRAAQGELSPSYLAMDGQEVFKFAVREMMDLLKTTFTATGLTHSDFQYIIPHQANIRIIKSCSERLGIPWEKFYLNIGYLGNISSATIPFALDELRKEGKLTEGDRVLFAAFGAGWTAGAAAITL